MQRICFLPYNPPSFAEMLALAKLLLAQRRWEPIMLLGGQALAARAPECAQQGLGHLVLPDLDQPGPRQPGPSGILSRLGPASIWRSLKWRWQGPQSELDLLKAGHLEVLAHQVGQLSQTLQRVMPAAVVVAGDRYPWWEVPLIGLCQRRGIPTLALPVSYVADKESLVPRRQSPFYLTRNFPELRNRFPSQAGFNPLVGQEVFFYQAPLTAALGELDLLPPNPWAHGGGRVDTMLAESQEARDRWVGLGTDPAKVVVTGHRAHDELYWAVQASRASVAKEDKGRSPVVLSLPQLWEEGIMDWEHARAELGLLCQTLAECAQERALVSLHPRMDPERYRFVEEEYGLTIARERLSTFIAQAHVFLATFSSTLFWAVLCGVPAVVFDFYGLEYSNWDFLTGTAIVKDKHLLGPQLARLLDDSAYHRHMAGEQRRWAARLSPFDGGCTDRILRAIEDAAGAGGEA